VVLPVGFTFYSLGSLVSASQMSWNKYYLFFRTSAMKCLTTDKFERCSRGEMVKLSAEKRSYSKSVELFITFNIHM